MSEDLANKVPQTDDEKLTLILSTVLSLTVRVDNVDLRLSRVEQTVDDTRSVLQEVRADILKLHEGQRAVSTEVRALRRDMDNRSGVIYGMLSEIQSDDRNIHERVTRWNSARTHRILKLDAPQSISYTAKRSND